MKKLFERIKGGISIEEILNKYKNCKVVDKINKDYSYGLSVYCSEKKNTFTKNLKFIIFHLGSLKYQRGSFIFFYKFLKDWNKIFLTFHEITKRFDVGKSYI